MIIAADPLLERLGRSLRGRLASVPAGQRDSAAGAIAVLAEMDAFRYELDPARGGYGLGVSCGAVVSEQLGLRGLPDVYGGPALLLAAAAGAADAAETVSQLAAGRGSVTLAGFDRMFQQPSSAVYPSRPPGPAAGMLGDWPAPHRLVYPVHHAGETTLAVAESSAGGGQPAPAGHPAPGQPLAALGHGDPPSGLDGLLASAMVRHAAYLVGLASAALTAGIRHITERRQFGRPLAEFQGTSFPLAGELVAHDAARLLVAQAAWSVDEGSCDDLAPVQALANAAETALAAVRVSMQAHGAVGMSDRTVMPVLYRAVREEMSRFGTVPALWRVAGMRRLAGQKADGARMVRAT